MSVQQMVYGILKELGEDPNREGLLKTPARVDRAYQFFTSGYRTDVSEIFKGATFREPCDEMVVVRDIEVYSLCEHHMLPFFGRCHVAYIPGDKILGLSKVARVVEVFARRLQVQERLTQQVAEAIQTHLEPRGVGVIMQARHLCMMMRGVEKQNSIAITSHLLGNMRDDPRTRAEFLNLCHPHT
jgi:GTP cyclohydrolase I